MLLKIQNSSHCTLTDCTNTRPQLLIIRPRTNPNNRIEHCNYKTTMKYSFVSSQPHMASALPSPSWPSQGCHPLRPLLLPQLPLHPPCHLSPPPSLPRLRRDHSHSRQETLSLCSNHARAQQSPVLAHNHTQLPLQLRSSSRPAQVLHPALSTSLNQSM